MTNQNLFKEAIADAKTVREIALQNAKVALEETLTPRLQSMLSTKLQEMEKEEEDLNENSTEDNLDEDFDISSILAELDETEDVVEEKKDDEDKDEEVEDEATAEDEAAEDETEAVEDEAEVLVKDMTADDLKVMIQDIVAQEMGAGTGDEMDLGSEEMPDLGTEETADLGVAAEEDNDEIDLEELLAELDALDETEDKDADLDEAKKDDKEVKTEAKKDKKELEEAIEVIKTLRNELHEQNLLNAKLLYVNKIFKAKNLTESQKLKVISSFDKATTVKEAKIVFESLNTALTSPKKQIKESLGFASKAAGNAPKTNIIETDAVVTRWQKLANIK